MFPRRALIALVLLSVFLIVVLVMVFTFLFQEASMQNPVLSFFVNNHFAIMVLASLSGLAVGGAVYSLMSERVETMVQASTENARLLLSLLPPSERRVVEYLVRNGGTGLQAELSRLEGMNRLKAHRIVDGLKRRGLVHVEAIGKLNKVFLSPSVTKALQVEEAPKPAVA